MLMSRKDSGAHAATLVFLLQSKVNTRAPLKRVRTEGPLYELQQFEFQVTNPFPAGEPASLPALLLRPSFAPRRHPGQGARLVHCPNHRTGRLLTRAHCQTPDCTATRNGAQFALRSRALPHEMPRRVRRRRIQAVA